MTLVAIDADVLGRERTGDETYVRNLLRELADLAPAGIRIAAVTRRPVLVPSGVEPVELRAGSQVLRMAVTLPRLLRRLGADLVHTQYALPLRVHCPGVVTVHDLSFEREPGLFNPRDRLLFRRVVPGAVRRATRVFTVSERTKRDLIELYDVPAEKVVVTPNGVDPAFHPAPSDTVSQRSYVLAVGAIQRTEEPAGGARGGYGGRPPARRRRAGEECGACEGAPPARCAPGGPCPRRAARRALPRGCLPRPGVPFRGLRAACRRGHGVGNAGRRRARACARGGCGRRSALRR